MSNHKINSKTIGNLIANIYLHKESELYYVSVLNRHDCLKSKTFRPFSSRSKATNFWFGVCEGLEAHKTLELKCEVGKS